MGSIAVGDVVQSRRKNARLLHIVSDHFEAPRTVVWMACGRGFYARDIEAPLATRLPLCPRCDKRAHR